MIKVFIACEYCKGQLIGEKKIVKHMKLVHNISDYNVESQHRVSYDESVSLYFCRKCGKTLSNMKQMQQHMQSHFVTSKKIKTEKKSTPRVSCIFCDSKAELSVINNHFKNSHHILFTYQDLQDGKTKLKLEEEEEKIIPAPIERKNSNNINCPECGIILSKDFYYKHFREDHSKKLEKLLDDYGLNPEKKYIGFWCPESKIDGRQHQGVYPIGKFKSKKLERYIPRYKCFTCGKFYLSEKEMEELKIVSKSGITYLNYPDLMEKQSEYAESKDEVKTKVVKDETKEKITVCSSLVLYVYSKLPIKGCHSQESERENILIETQTSNGNVIKINAFRCKKCKKIFNTFESVAEYFKFGKPLIEIQCINDGEYELRDFSELSLVGYNVRADGLGYQSSTRIKLLQTVLDNRIIERGKIINLLKSFISRAKNKKNMEHAIECWESDLDFVSNHTVPGTKKIEAHKITIKCK